MKDQLNIKRIMAEAIHKGYMSDLHEGLTSPNPEVVTSPDDSTNGTDDLEQEGFETRVSEDTFGDHLGDTLAPNDEAGEVHTAFSDAVMDVLQDNAKKVIANFTKRLSPGFTMPKGPDGLTGLADDVADAVLQNSDVRETLVQIATHTLKKRM